MADQTECRRAAVRKAGREHVEPAVRAFLMQLENDFAAGRNLRPMPSDLIAAMREALKDAKVDLDTPIEGAVGV